MNDAANQLSLEVTNLALSGEAVGVTGAEIRDMLGCSLPKAHKTARALVEQGVLIETEWLRIRGEWVERSERESKGRKIPGSSIVYIHAENAHFYA